MQHYDHPTEPTDVGANEKRHLLSEPIPSADLIPGILAGEVLEREDPLIHQVEDSKAMAI